MKYIMILAMFLLSMCTPVHAMENQDFKNTKTVNQIIKTETQQETKCTLQYETVEMGNQM